MKLGAIIKDKVVLLGAIITDKEVFIKRLKGFAWELGNMGLVAVLGFVANNLELVNLPPYAIGIIALVVNQITKQLNSKK